MIIDANVKGIDFYHPYPDLKAAWADGCRFLQAYLKDWEEPLIKQWHDLGGGCLPISEHAADSALGGTSVGTAHGQQAVQDSRTHSIPTPTIVILTHDTSTLTPAVGDYFRAAELQVRAGGYGFGGYCDNDTVNICRAHGVTFDFISSPAATAWGHGRHPDSHVWQFPSLVRYGVRVDPNLSKKSFEAWGTAPTPVPPPQGGTAMTNEMQFVVTNKETRHNEVDGKDYPPHNFVYRVMENGAIRHVSDPIEGALYWHFDLALVPEFPNSDLDAWLARGPAGMPTSMRLTLSGGISGSVSLSGTATPS